MAVGGWLLVHWRFSVRGTPYFNQEIESEIL